MFNKYRSALAVVPVVMILSTASIAHAAQVVIHGKVLSTTPKSSVFRIRVEETGKERSVFTTTKTLFKFSNGKVATFADVKVGKTVEVKGEVKSADAYTASAVSIRL